MKTADAQYQRWFANHTIPGYKCDKYIVFTRKIRKSEMHDTLPDEKAEIFLFLYSGNLFSVLIFWKHLTDCAILSFVHVNTVFHVC